VIGSIQPLTEVKGRYETTDEPGKSRGVYVVICRECGDVTREESGFTVDEAPIQQAGIYRQRHLSRHLSALANEVAEAAR
jgi:hypothetical protein